MSASRASRLIQTLGCPLFRNLTGRFGSRHDRHLVEFIAEKRSVKFRLAEAPSQGVFLTMLSAIQEGSDRSLLSWVAGCHPEAHNGAYIKEEH